MTKFTSGPWTLKHTGHKFEIPEIGLQWHRSHSTDPERDREIRESEQGQQELAHAHLLAAAPKLCAACKMALRRLEQLDADYKKEELGPDPAMEALRDAIAQAEANR